MICYPLYVSFKIEICSLWSLLLQSTGILLLSQFLLINRFIFLSILMFGVKEALSAPSRLSLRQDILDFHCSSFRLWENVLVTLLIILRHRHQMPVLKPMPAHDNINTAFFAKWKDKNQRGKTQVFIMLNLLHLSGHLLILRAIFLYG